MVNYADWLPAMSVDVLLVIVVIQLLVWSIKMLCAYLGVSGKVIAKSLESTKTDDKAIQENKEQEELLLLQKGTLLSLKNDNPLSLWKRR